LRRITILLVSILLFAISPYAANGELAITESGNYYPDGPDETTAQDIPRGTITYSTPGSYTFIVPMGVRRLAVEAWGGGGGGGVGSDVYGGGGGAGGRYRGIVTVRPGTYAVVVGAGGAGGTVRNSAGSKGGDSSFGGNMAIATGGGGGVGLIGGIGGNASGAQAIPGQDGRPGGDGVGSAASEASRHDGDGGGGNGGINSPALNGKPGKITIFW
jgi:hypothetical protein